MFVFLCMCVLKVKLKHLGGFLSSASFISCIAHYNFVPHSGSSFHCFHFIRFPLVFLLKAPFLFSPDASLHLSDSPTSYHGGGSWERAPTVPRRDWLLPARRSANSLCVFGCVSYSESISLITTTAIHPKAPLTTILMPDSLGARRPPQVTTYDWLSQWWSWISSGCPETWISAITCLITHLFQGAEWICHTLQIYTVLHSLQIDEGIQKVPSMKLCCASTNQRLKNGWAKKKYIIYLLKEIQLHPESRRK